MRHNHRGKRIECSYAFGIIITSMPLNFSLFSSLLFFFPLVILLTKRRKRAFIFLLLSFEVLEAKIY